MRRLLFFLIVAAFFGTANAQEFSLKLTLTVNGNVWPKPLYLGYDPSAVDSFYRPGKWPMSEYPEGEVEVPSDGFGDVDFRFTGKAINRGYLGDGSYINIEPKPNIDSFQIRYEVDLRADVATSAKITWDASSIPAIIKHLYWATSSKPDAARLDMTKVGEFNIPIDSLRLGKYQQSTLTLLYNEDHEDVRSVPVFNSISLFPTLVRNGDLLHLLAPQGELAECRLIDLLGRSIRLINLTLNVGVNVLPMEFSDVTPGTYVVEIRGRSNPTNVMRRQIIIQ